MKNFAKSHSLTHGIALFQISTPCKKQLVSHLWCTRERFREHLHLVTKIRTTWCHNALVWCRAGEESSALNRHSRNDQEAQSVLWSWAINRGWWRLQCLCNLNTVGLNPFILRKVSSVGTSLFYLSPYENRRLLNDKHLKPHTQFNAAHLKPQTFSLNVQGEIIACCMVITGDIKHFSH